MPKQKKTITENESRCIRAENALSFYEDNTEGNITDLLTDLRHLCRKESISFDDAVRISAYHFETEKGGES